MEDAGGSLEAVDWIPELGTRRSSTAGPFPLSAKVGREFISEEFGGRRRRENLLDRRDCSGRTRIECQQKTGKHGLCQSKDALN